MNARIIRSAWRPPWRFSWFVLAYTVAVILWGAYVRATGSGAGCGEHWPLCDGRIVPRAEKIETIIELTHRLTSGLSLILVVAMAVRVRRAFRPGHLARKAAAFSVVLILTEALIGAGLVLFGLVAGNQSAARAGALALHLLNTLLLLGAIASTAWFSAMKEPRWTPLEPKLRQLAGMALGFCLVVGASGAVTALGDTLFPGQPTVFTTATHVLIRFRVLHPLLAVTTAAVLLILCQALRVRHLRSPRETAVRRAGTAVATLVGVQLVAGLTNVALLAPTWLQLVHLTLADALWVALVTLVLAGFSEDRTG